MNSQLGIFYLTMAIFAMVIVLITLPTLLERTGKSKKKKKSG